VTVVERIDEVEADVARNQFKARRTPARDFRRLFRFSQKILPVRPISYYLTA
jgi:hypothetical protein